MRYLKTFESKSDFTFIDIVRVLDEIAESSDYLVSICDSNYDVFFIEDATKLGIEDRFTLNLPGGGKFFKLIIRFRKPKNFFETSDFMKELKSIIGRFEDFNFSLYQFFFSSELKIHSDENIVKWVPDSKKVIDWMDSSQEWTTESAHFEFVSK